MIVRKEQNEIPKEPIVQEQRIEPIMTQPPLRWSSRVSRPHEKYDYLLQGHKLYAVAKGNHLDNLSIYDQAMMDVDSTKWQGAMQAEMNSMHVNQVWTLVDCLRGWFLLGASGSTRKKMVHMAK